MISRGPWRCEENGRVYVAYASTRLTFRKDAWDLLPEDGFLVVLVLPEQGAVVAVVMTKADIRRVFPNVLKSFSWIERGIYNYASFPSKAKQLVRRVEDLPECVRECVGKALGLPRRAKPRKHVDEPLPESVTRATSIIDWSNAVAEWANVAPESPAYLESVKAWRDAWRPERVRFLLVAESHVGELPGDTDVRVKVPGRPDLPTSYCRLVYCLGYGGSRMCEPKAEKNRGTPQYWEILASIAARRVVRAPSAIDEKLRVLEELRRRGIWLVDSSVTACYVPRGRRFKASHEVPLVRDSWERFVWPEVEGDRPEQVWVIGVSVGLILGDHPAIRDDRVIPQPQIRNRELHLAELARMVESICEAEREGRGC